MSLRKRKDETDGVYFRGEKCLIMGVKKRFLLFLVADSLIVTTAVLIGYYILEPFFLEYSPPVLLVAAVILLVSHHIFAYIFNLYHRAWQFASVREMISIAQSVTCSVLTSYIIILMIFEFSFTRLMIITWMMHLILIGASRLSWRVVAYHINGNYIRTTALTKTLVVGVGKGGSVLIKQMLESPAIGMNPVVAVDDDPMKQRMEVCGGVRVEGTRDDIQRLIKKYDIQKVIIAIPSVTKNELRKINELSLQDGVEVMTMPSINGVLSGKIEVNILRKVEVEDLLGREPVELDTDGIEDQVMDRTILITGAGGS